MTTRSIPAQVRMAFGPGHRLGSILSLYFGALPPLAVWWVTHRELDPNQPVWNQPLTIIVLAGLAFSAVKVAKWAQVAFGNWVEAVGFVVLMEGTMTYVHTEWLSIVVLAGLMFINSVSTACSVADEEAQTADQVPESDGLNLSSFPTSHDRFKNMTEVVVKDVGQVPENLDMTPAKIEFYPIANDTRIRTEVLGGMRNAIVPEPIPDQVVQATETAAQNMPLLKRTRRPRVR